MSTTVDKLIKLLEDREQRQVAALADTREQLLGARALRDVSDKKVK